MIQDLGDFGGVGARQGRAGRGTVQKQKQQQD
jgi:hypothetical protein